MQGHTNAVGCLIFSHDGKFLISGSADRIIRIWDVKNFTAHGSVLEGHTGWVTCLDVSYNDGVLGSGSTDCTVRIWDNSKPQAVERRLTGHTAAVISVAVLTGSVIDDQKLIASVSADANVRIWDIQTGELVQAYQAPHHGEVVSAAVSWDQRMLAWATDDDSLEVWLIREGSGLSKWSEAITNGARSLAFSRDDRQLFCGTDDGALRVYSTDRLSLISTLEGHSDWVNYVVVSFDGERLASASSDSTVFLWNAAKARAADKPSDLPNGAITEMGLSRDGATVIAVTTDYVVWFWDIHSGTSTRIELQEISTYGSWSTILSADKQTLICTSNFSDVGIWDVHTGAPLIRSFYRNTRHHIADMAISTDSRILACSFERAIQLLDLSARTTMGPPLQCTGTAYSLAFSPDGRYLAAATSLSDIPVWDLEKRTRIHTLRGHSGSVGRVAFSPNNRHIVAAYGFSDLRLWDIQADQPLLRQFTEGHKRPVTALVFSPDGGSIASGSDEGLINLWDATDGRLKGTLNGHQDRIQSLIFSTDGNHLTSSSSDRCIRVWTLDSQQSHRLCFSPDPTHAPSPIYGHDEDGTTISITPDGWIKCGEDHLLWFPPDEIPFLCMPGTSHIFPRMICLDLSTFRHGLQWDHVVFQD